jgi:hypothetical protein
VKTNDVIAGKKVASSSTPVSCWSPRPTSTSPKQRMLSTNRASASMLTVICESPRNLQALQRLLLERAPGEVLLRVKRVVCGTDLHIFTGNQPYLAYPA